MVARRTLLGAGAATAGLVAVAAAGVETDLLPGRVALHAALGLNGPAATLPGATATLVSGAFDSKARRTRVGWTVAYPSGHRPGDALPVLIALHGRFVDHTSLFGEHIGLDHYLAADPALSFAIAAADGGDTYWHPRRSGEDAAAMITDEFLPLLADRGLHTQRVGLYGFSMGGYGALRLAGQIGAARVAVVVAASAALFRSAGESAAGAFDDAADFAANDLFGRQARLDGIAVRLDCGRGDPFVSAVRAYGKGFATAPAGGFQAGGHDENYWRRMAPDELSFVGRSLAA